MLPIIWLQLFHPVLTDTDVWILVIWWFVFPFFAYRRAKIVEGRAEARKAERLAATIAEGMRRDTKP